MEIETDNLTDNQEESNPFLIKMMLKYQSNIESSENEIDRYLY